MMSEKATYDQAKRVLKIIGNEADRLYDMVSQLMDLARMQSASLTLHPEEKSLYEVVDSFQLQLSAMTPNHCLMVNIHESLPPAWIDGHRIKQVILNLVANAVKFSPLHTLISLKAFLIERGIQVEVCNEGEGIPVDKRTCVFEAFRQLETPSQYKGVGLGLAICKGIIDAHGGQIWVADDVVSGTTVCFTLPTCSGAQIDK
jgi:two-component system sensor histidine kinase KdpD